MGCVDSDICCNILSIGIEEVRMNEQTIVALAAALFGGGGLKLIEHFLTRSKTRVDLAAQLRNELRTEINGLRQEVKEVDDSLDDWKRRYYRLLGHYHDIRAKCVAGGVDVPEFVEDHPKEK